MSLPDEDEVFFATAEAGTPTSMLRRGEAVLDLGEGPTGVVDRTGEDEPEGGAVVIDFLPKNDKRPPEAFFFESLMGLCWSVFSFGTMRQPEGTKSASVTSGFDFMAASHDKDPLEFMYTASGLWRVTM